MRIGKLVAAGLVVLAIAAFGHSAASSQPVSQTEPAKTEGYDEYRLQGCNKWARLVGDDKPMTMLSCKQMAEKTVEKSVEDGFVNCVIGTLTMRAVWLHDENPAPAVSRQAKIACIMIIHGMREESANRWLERIDRWLG